MAYLLDTHTFLWFINADKALSQKAKLFIEDSTESKFVSIVSIWEIAVKLSIGKLSLDFQFEELRQHLVINNFKILPILFEDSALLTTLPFYHRDPFDRMLIAQAMNRNFTIISKDQNFPSYQVPLAW